MFYVYVPLIVYIPIPMQPCPYIYTYLHIMATMRSNKPMASTKANPRIA